MKAFDILANALVWALVALWVLPFVAVLMVSLLPSSVVFARGWLPPDIGHVSLRNYAEVLFGQYGLLSGLRNSLLLASVSAVATVALAAMAAYGFVHLPIRHRSLLFGLFLFVMLAPQYLAVISVYLVYSYIGKALGVKLYDSLPGLAIFHTAWALGWATFFLRNYLSLLPRSVVEAARVDGASEFTIFRRVILPLAAPGLVAASLLQFTWVWNDFFYALVFLVSPQNWVATQVVVYLKGGYNVVDWGLAAAGSAISMAVPVALYLAFSRHFMRGVAGWGVKR